MSACDDCVVPSGNDPQFRRILWIALIANAAMFFIEITASYFAESMSLQADALDFFGDAANYAISLFVAGMVLTVRAKAALFKGVTMGVFGCWVAAAAIYRAVAGSTPDAVTMGAIAVLALVVNVTVAVMLYRYRGGDSNMQSVWLCSRNDAIINMAVIVAALGVFASNTRWPDLFVAIGIAGLSLSSAFQVIRAATREINSEAANAHR